MSVGKGFAYGFGGYFGFAVAQIAVGLFTICLCCGCPLMLMIGGVGTSLHEVNTAGIESQQMLARQQAAIDEAKAKKAAAKPSQSPVVSTKQADPVAEPPKRSPYIDYETKLPKGLDPPPNVSDEEKAKREAERQAQAELDAILEKKRLAEAETLKAKQAAEAREKDAMVKLGVAKKLTKANVRARRLRELIEAYPGTAAAAEATKLLEADEEK